LTFIGLHGVISQKIQLFTGENMKISAEDNPGYYDMKQDTPRFDEACSKLLYRGKEAKTQWLQYPGKINAENLNNVRREARGYFRNKTR
jgi:hypothetical protein